MSQSTNPVPKIYRAVIEDVIKNVRESFLNEGVDEQVLSELKQLWENKLLQSRAVECMPTDINVRVSLTYPHNVQQIPNRGGSSQSSSQSSSPQVETPQRAQSTQNHIINQAGQLVYVSSHPTLGNVGAVSGAAAQAAMALQNNPRASGSLMSQPGLHQAQVLHVQGGQQVHQQATMFPSFQGRGGPGVAPARVIFRPAQLQQQQQQQQAAQIKQPVIQVDGSNDSEVILSLPVRKPIVQLDGGQDSSSEDDLDDEEDEDFDNIPIAHVPATGVSGDLDDGEGVEEEPLNSEDDVSDEDPTDLFDTDNVVVCQYDKIARTRNRWKFHLKDGIMNLNSKDYVFHKANGDSEW